MEYLVVARGELLDLTAGGTVGRDPGHEPTWLDVDGIDDVIDVTLRVCPDCGDDLGQATQVTTRLIEEIPEPPPIDTIQYNLHQYSCDGCDSTVEATHSDCPPEGNFGVNVLAQAAHARYECRLPYRKIADRFPDLLGLKLSDASAWYCVQRVAEAGATGTRRSSRRSARRMWSTSTKPASVSTATKGGSGRSRPKRRSSTKSPRAAGAR